MHSFRESFIDVIVYRSFLQPFGATKTSPWIPKNVNSLAIHLTEKNQTNPNDDPPDIITPLKINGWNMSEDWFRSCSFLKFDDLQVNHPLIFQGVTCIISVIEFSLRLTVSLSGARVWYPPGN